MFNRKYISANNIIISFVLFVLFISSCKTSSVNNGRWHQKRKYNKGWYFNISGRIESSNEKNSVSFLPKDSLTTSNEKTELTLQAYPKREPISFVDTIKQEGRNSLQPAKTNTRIHFVRNESQRIPISINSTTTQRKKALHKRAPPQWLVDLFSQNGIAEALVVILLCFVIGCGFLIDWLWRKRKGWAYALAWFIIVLLVTLYLLGGAWAPQFYALFFALTALLALVTNDGTMNFWERVALFLFILAIAAFYYWIYITFFNVFWTAILLQCALYGSMALLALLTGK